MDDPVLTFFSQNLAAISKEELLQALRNALQSANYWREACLNGGFSTQTCAGSKLEFQEAEQVSQVRGHVKGDPSSAKI